MKAARILLPLLILSWTMNAATLHFKKREIGRETLVNGVGRGTTLEASGPRWTSGRSHLILQFHKAVSDDLVRELNQRGAFVVGAVPDFGVTVSVPDDLSLEGMDIVWAGRMQLGDKISALLESQRRPIENWVVAEFYPDVDMREARRLAEAAGFRVHEHPDLIPWHLLLSGPGGRLSGLAQWDEVAYLFPASRELIRGERVGHCMGALSTGGTTPMYVTASSGWAKDSSGQVTLSYVFGNLTPKLQSSQATQAILSALNAWTPYAPIKFVAGQSATASRTIYIWFASGNHGDGFPFDGPGGILAHTFYPAPPNPESIAGDMHFDADEDWHIGADTDLYTVAVHEAGHALGLAHVDDPAALMYPYYRLGSKIAAGDIAGVQSLYGPAAASAPVTSAPSPASNLTLAISTPHSNSSTAGSMVAMAGTSSGAQGAETVTWQTDHGSSGIASGATTWSAAVPLSPGINTITVTASDTLHKAVQSVNVTRTASLSPTPANPAPPIDHTPPTISISSPTGSIVSTTAATIDIKGIAADNVGVSKVTWQACQTSGIAAGTTNWTVSAIPLLLGDNTIVVRAYDAAGNTTWRSVLVIRN
jgi:hypothetical protein